MTCPKCKKEMELKIRSELIDSDLKKPYIFSIWHRCTCGFIQHYKKYKIINKTTEYLLNGKISLNEL